MGKKHKIMATEQKVRLHPDEGELRKGMAASFREPFNVDNMTAGKIYQAAGITQKVYDDGSSCLCFLIVDDRGTLSMFAADLMQVVDE